MFQTQAVQKPKTRASIAEADLKELDVNDQEISLN
jgi:hypothetical protein